MFHPRRIDAIYKGIDPYCYWGSRKYVAVLREKLCNKGKRKPGLVNLKQRESPKRRSFAFRGMISSGKAAPVAK